VSSDLGNFSEWTYKKLKQTERSYPIGHLIGEEIRLEIKRRQAERNQQYVLAGVVAAAFAALGSMVAAFASLMAVFKITH
jgi:hypothetical protein